MSLPQKLLTYRELRVSGMSRYKAAKQAGFSRGMCLRASRLDDAVAIALPEILEKEGVDNFLIAEKIKAGLNAERAIVTTKKTFENGKLASEEPEIVYVPDEFIRHKYLDTYLDITGQKKKQGASDAAGDAPANLPQLIVNTLNITVDKRPIVEVVS